MKIGFYPKLAVSGIRKNKETYFPYMLTCIGMVMMYYIVSFLWLDTGMDAMKGGAQMRSILGFGSFVIAAFAVIFLFYTNSFLIRRRKKEFGLYNILGMNKWNISRILVYETVVLYLVTTALGIGCGILFSRLAQFAMVRIMGGGAVLTFRVLPQPVRNTVILFAAIFLLLFINGLRQIHLSNPIELLHSEQTGEKPPKGNWFLAVLGAVVLGIAYYMAITIQSPIDALAWFFVAVILVIAATYLLFIAGSVTICAFLRKCKGYYYQTNHFVSTSFMAYRMKRNGAGLASICILSTMVLVMISTTVCLYVGEEAIVDARYPWDVMVTTTYGGEEQTQTINGFSQKAFADWNLGADDSHYYRYMAFASYRSGTEMVVDPDRMEQPGKQADDIWAVIVIPVEYYDALSGSSTALAEDEVLAYTVNGSYTEDSVTIEGLSFHIREMVEDIGALSESSSNSTYPVIYLLVAGTEQMQEIQNIFQADALAANAPDIREVYGYELSGSAESQIEAGQVFREDVFAYIGNEPGKLYVEIKAKERSGFYADFGGLFFLGILLGIVFVFAVALIMYYKQIIEGHEDSGRFEILQKVGMTQTEVKQSINSSVLTVFFMPLIAAGIHILAAFPIISKMLLLFGMTDKRLFLITVCVCFLVFSAFYMIMYVLTSKAYYRIVKR